jgi:hypothetical protein
LFRIFSRYKRLSSALSLFGDTADFAVWIKSTFGRVEFFANREDLWEEMARRLDLHPVRGIELGVAFGYSTAWWLARLPQTILLSWDGFDRFTGLPRSWRGYPEGAFAASGNPPELNDERITWHIGDVQSTIAHLDFESLRRPECTWAILFDFDLFEPSLVAWESLRWHLRPGDLLYFDEAFDRDERHLIVHSILTSGDFAALGVTLTGLCLEVIEAPS